MTLLTFVRHGETDWNRAGRIQGAVDIPLNDTGREQARQAGLALRDTLDPEMPVFLAASDMARAVETAGIIADLLGAPSPERYPALRERSYGEAEGMLSTDYHQRWGDGPEASIPGAEAWSAVRARALTGVSHAVRDARRISAPASAAVIVVAHGGVIRQLIRHASGDEFPAAGERIPNGSAHTFLVERERMQLLSYVTTPVLAAL